MSAGVPRRHRRIQRAERRRWRLAVRTTSPKQRTGLPLPSNRRPHAAYVEDLLGLTATYGHNATDARATLEARNESREIRVKRTDVGQSRSDAGDLPVANGQDVHYVLVKSYAVSITCVVQFNRDSVKAIQVTLGHDV